MSFGRSSSHSPHIAWHIASLARGLRSLSLLSTAALSHWNELVAHSVALVAIVEDDGVVGHQIIIKVHLGNLCWRRSPAAIEIPHIDILWELAEAARIHTILCNHGGHGTAGRWQIDVSSIDEPFLHGESTAHLAATQLIGDEAIRHRPLTVGLLLGCIRLAELVARGLLQLAAFFDQLLLVRRNLLSKG